MLNTNDTTVAKYEIAYELAQQIKDEFGATKEGAKEKARFIYELFIALHTGK